MNPGRHVNRLPANCSNQQQESSGKYPNDLFESDEIVRKQGRMAQLVVPGGRIVRQRPCRCERVAGKPFTSTLR